MMNNSIILLYRNLYFYDVNFMALIFMKIALERSFYFSFYHSKCKFTGLKLYMSNTFIFLPSLLFFYCTPIVLWQFCFKCQVIYLRVNLHYLSVLYFQPCYLIHWALPHYLILTIHSILFILSDWVCTTTNS